MLSPCYFSTEPHGPLHGTFFAEASDPSPRVWLEEHGKTWPMKNRHQPQSPMYFARWDKRLCDESCAVVAAAHQGELAMRRLLNEPPAKGGIARGETLLATRVTACLTAAGVLPSSGFDADGGDAPTGGPGSHHAMHSGRDARENLREPKVGSS